MSPATHCIRAAVKRRNREDSKLPLSERRLQVHIEREVAEACGVSDRRVYLARLGKERNEHA